MKHVMVDLTVINSILMYSKGFLLLDSDWCFTEVYSFTKNFVINICFYGH
jgi:hypothetical protein